MAIENHVTRERRERFEALAGIVSLDDFPPLTSAQVEFLKQAYQPRCWDPSKETDVIHLKYAGKVELAQMLIQHSEQKTLAADLEIDPDAEKAG